MGYALCMGNCILCDRLFGFNPNKVPSTTLFTGKREPVCQQCMDRLIAKERALGITPKVYSDDAYEAMPEEDL